MSGFRTSFEAGDPVPTWVDTPDIGTDPVGVTLRTRLGSGPVSAPAAKADVGFTGLRSLRYEGEVTAPNRAINRLFWSDQPVEADTELAYVVFPELLDRRYPSTYVAVDLAFDDGTRLSELGAVDQLGFGFTAREQGASRALFPDQWNHRVVRLGPVALGRVIARVLLAVDCPHAPAAFAGWVDDLTIGPAPTRTAAPVDRIVTTRGTHSTGSFSRGNTIPATAVPHGFNFWVPVTNAAVTNWSYEYHRGNTDANRPALQAIGLSHLPSPWMGDRHTFHFMPTTGTAVGRRTRALTFDRADEHAHPYHYDVTFDNGVRAEIAPADHAAVLRFHFPPGPANLVLDNVGLGGEVRVDGDTITGHTDVRSGLSVGAGRMWVHAESDHPIARADHRWRGLARARTMLLRYAPGTRTVTLRVATSLIGPEQARRNLAEADTFDAVRDRARDAWSAITDKIDVEGATDDQLTTLYSCLYRLFLYPNSAHEDTDTGRRHASPTSDPPAVLDGSLYVNNGFWDTYRTCWPAYALFAPRRCGELVDGFLQHYRDGGWVPRWSSPGYADLMTGTSSNVAFADAHAKGVTGFDVQDAYNAALRDATVVPPHNGVGRKGLDRSIFLHHTPMSTPDGLSWALEGCVNDFGIAGMAAALGDEDNHAYFTDRARHYAHHFDPAVGFFQGRDGDRFRRDPHAYDPRVWGYDYTETNGWTAAFAVPHDPAGLAALHGGPEVLADKLDTYFGTPETAEYPGSYGRPIHEMTEARDVRMGQYGHSNQPAHHIAYLPGQLGRPWRTQELVRDVLARLYQGSDIGQGYCGDEDNGEMSAWYLFSALGFYPLRVGSGVYAIGSPLFPRAVVHLDNGRDLRITAHGNNHRNVYVQSLTVDGAPHDTPWISHDTLTSGAHLEFTMGPEPSTWGATATPEPLGDGPPLRDITTGLPGALFDDDAHTESTVDSPVTVTTTDPTRVLIYTLTSASTGPDPTAWTLRGSHDGHTWHDLDTRTDQSFPWRKQTRPFKVALPARYRHYGVIFRDTTRLAQIQLLADGGT
ncbi:GH92 family glycosyl hydrolase [Actinokineospora auranticolor]|uniref:Putative alpha-1,2-mannosidase n=1 Tax=Actinokineospora auranticolor TaxID=155976 RepID=A0A2S6GP80_9PSEU|nr:GH92 family glycosyl hydrolase [Actinokineospora auranticolor]PPK67052.1 putative alpha-1,2-mannosidase [Actinokineospora auranticolor]